MKKIAFFMAAASLLAIPLISCNSNSQTKANEENAAAISEETVQEAEATVEEVDGSVISLSDDNLFRPDTKVSKVTVLDFNATWCVPCKKLTPAYEKAAEELGHKVSFYSVDIDKNPLTKEAFDIQGVPTVVILSPNSPAKSYVSLEPFMKGAPQNADAEQLTAVILANLLEIIKAAE